ncbi:MAG: hypothetical protein DRG78_06625 [Epsilonproteobacteria bacterium]|nr:MAG: hypothetical protein DRG78_06625 [Campylobacterota bacterium]
MRKLLTEKMLSEIPDLYSTEDISDPVCHVKLFTPDSNWSWYITEISKDDNITCFGYVIGNESELGYFNLLEIENIKGALGLEVEVDIHFTPTLLSKVKRGS